MLMPMTSAELLLLLLPSPCLQQQHGAAGSIASSLVL